MAPVTIERPKFKRIVPPSPFLSKLYGKDDRRSAETELVAAEIDAANGEQHVADAKAEAAPTILIARRGRTNPRVAEADRVLRKILGRKG